MASTKLLVFLLVAVSAASARSVRDVPEPTVDVADLTRIFGEHTAGGGDDDELALRALESVFPSEHRRSARQVHGSASANPAGGTDITLGAPLAGNEHAQLGAVASAAGLGGRGGGGYERAGAGLALGTSGGHSASVLGTHIPGFGNQLTAAGRVNVLSTDDHKLGASAFGSRTFPSNPAIPSFGTYGGGVDYLYKDRVGASLSAARTPLFQKTDYSAMGNLNLFKDRTSSLDLNAGFSKSVSPYIPNSSWQPAGGITFTKYW